MSEEGSREGSYISFLHYEPQGKMKFLKTFWNLDNKFVFQMY